MLKISIVPFKPRPGYVLASGNGPAPTHSVMLESPGLGERSLCDCELEAEARAVAFGFEKGMAAAVEILGVVKHAARRLDDSAIRGER